MHQHQLKIICQYLLIMATLQRLTRDHCETKPVARQFYKN